MLYIYIFTRFTACTVRSDIIPEVKMSEDLTMKKIMEEQTHWEILKIFEFVPIGTTVLFAESLGKCE